MEVENYPKEYSNHALIIMKAAERGYWFDFETKQMVTPKGTKVTPKTFGKQRYPCMTINDGTGMKHNVSFAIHKFVGYMIFGEIALRKGVNVRHLDDNPLNLSKENIAIGTSRDNNLDKPPCVRSDTAKRGRSSQGVRPVTSVVKDDEAEIILRKYLKIKGNLKRAKQGTICAIMKEHPYTRECLQSICSGHSFPDIYERVIKEFSFE